MTAVLLGRLRAALAEPYRVAHYCGPDRESIDVTVTTIGGTEATIALDARGARDLAFTLLSAADDYDYRGDLRSRQAVLSTEQ